MMEYTCLVAGDASSGIDTLIDLLLEFSLPAALREKEKEKINTQQINSTKTTNSTKTKTTNECETSLRRLELANPSLPNITIHVTLEKTYTPSTLGALEWAPAAVILVFSVFSADSLQYLKTFWVPWLRHLTPLPSVILVGMINHKLLNMNNNSNNSNNNGVSVNMIQPTDIALLATETHAKAYFEVEEDSNSNSVIATILSELRLGIARACTGELIEVNDIQLTDISEYREKNPQSPLWRSPPVLSSTASSIVSPFSNGSLLLLSPSSPKSPTLNANNSIWTWRRHPKTNRLFYVNRTTKKSQYRRPQDYDGEEPILTLEEHVELERERQTQLQRERELQQEREELVQFNRDMEEQEQRLKVKQSYMKRLEHIVQRLRHETVAIEHQRNSNNVIRTQISQLREEVVANERSFLQESADFHASLEEKIMKTKQALMMEEKEGISFTTTNNDITNNMNMNMNTSSSSSSVTAAISGLTQMGETTIVEERDKLHTAIQSIVQSTRSVISQLRECVEHGIKKREVNAITHTELTITQKRIESLLLIQIPDMDAEEEEISKALSKARIELRETEKALEPLLATQTKRQSLLRKHQAWAENARLEEELLMKEIQDIQINVDLAKKQLRQAQMILRAEDGYERARLQRARDVQYCITAYVTLSSSILSLLKLKEQMELILNRFSQLFKQRQEVLGNVREKYVQKRLALLQKWYLLDAEMNKSTITSIEKGNIKRELHILSESMEQLDIALDQLESYTEHIENGSISVEIKLQQAWDVLLRSPEVKTELMSKSNSVVETCWMLLSNRLCDVMQCLTSAVTSVMSDSTNITFNTTTTTNNNNDSSDNSMRCEKRESTAFTDHMIFLQQEIWSCAAKRLLRDFTPEELQQVVSSLSTEEISLHKSNSHHDIGISSTDNSNHNNDDYIDSNVKNGINKNNNNIHNNNNNNNNNNKWIPSPLWVKQMLLSVLTPGKNSHGLTENEVIVNAEERVVAQRDGSNELLRERLRQAYA